MIEMFDVNTANTTIANATATTLTIFDNIQQTNNTSNIHYASPEINATSTTATTGALQYPTDASIALNEAILNTTAIVVDYATQWLSSTIATVAANMTTISEITSATDAFVAPSTFLRNTTMYRHNSDGSAGSSLYPDLIMTNPKAMANSDGTDEDLHDCHPRNPNFNCSSSDFMEYVMGPKTLPLYKALLVTIIYGGIFITGILGNVLICVVIVKHQTMHIATNYYLFSLAVSDLIFLLFGLPTEVFMYWHQYPYLFGLPFCKFRAYVSEACSYVSVFTIVAFSVERYLAICHPLYLYAMSGFKRALRIIALLWVISFLGAIPFGMLTEIKYLYIPTDYSQIEESAFCVMLPPPSLYVFEISFVVFFLIPILLMVYLYGRMAAKIRSRTTQKLGVQQGSMHRESRHQQSRKAVIWMLAAVVITFFICWLPFHAQRLFYVYGADYKYYSQINELLFSITGFAYYVSCTVNPILYNVMSHRYRVAFKDTLCGKRKSVYYNNGFARDLSSFRGTTVATSLGNSGVYERGYGRSFKVTNNIKDRTSNNILWKKPEFCTSLTKEIPENHTVTNAKSNNSTNAVVVCVDNGVNGRTKVFTENEAQESLLSKNNETCI